MDKDSKIYKGKKERVKSIALKAKKESSDDETSTSGSVDEEYAMAVRNFKKFFRRKSRFVRQLREEKKSFWQRDYRKSLGFEKSKASTSGTKQISFVGLTTTLAGDGSTLKVCLRISLETDEWNKDSGCSKHMTGNKSMFSTYKAYDGGNVVFGSNLKGKIIGKEDGSEITKDDKFIENGLYVMKLGNKSQDKLSLATLDDNSTLLHRKTS
nr:retrovirus-related Pol polyprotein from transposon TNT 1-94 [Tanacetum cinerariifolium]